MLRYEKLIPVLFFLFFMALTAPGVSWGAPGFWHPDEILQMADKALERGYRFDEKNFDYPSLPKYVMYGVGRLVYTVGLDKTKFIEAARLVSVILGGLIVALSYVLTRRMGGGVLSGTLAALFLISNRDLAIYSRFAHGDPYLVFFACLTVLSLLQYRVKGHRIWLYCAFLGVGLATTSKYNGIGLFLAVVIVFLVANRRRFFEDPFTFFEMFVAGVLLSAFGYAVGTPRSVLSMAFYIQNALPAILRQATYDRDPETMTGLFGQWRVISGALGSFVFLLFLAALLWYGFLVIRHYTNRRRTDDLRLDLIAIVLLCATSLDLPVLISYHYPPRFFLSILPLLAVLGGMFVEDSLQRIERLNIRYLKEVGLAAVVLILSYSFLRVIAVMLLFLNDNRIPSSRFLVSLPKGSTLEYTSSPPNIPARHFSKLYEHPLYVKKFANQPAPEGDISKFNQGEAGVEQRQPEYLLVDSFTYEDYLNQSDCVSVQVECEFYRRLFAGETHYELIKIFDYRLPPYLPETRATFVNPVIQIYRRK